MITDKRKGLLVVETHPIQYHAPIYRMLQQRFDIPVTAIYGSDFSIAGYRDREFATTFAWDTDLISGYTTFFLSKVAEGGAPSDREVHTKDFRRILQQTEPKVILLTGYSPRFYQIVFWYSWRSGYPLIFRAETTDYAHERCKLKSRARDIFLRWFYKQYRHLLFVGQLSKQHYQRLQCSNSKLTFSPYCVNTSVFRVSEADRDCLRGPTRQNLEISNSRLVILFSGKLVARKAPDLILQAVKALPDHLRNRIVVVFLGSGQMSESLRKLAQTPPVVEVRFVGFQNQKALSCYYHAADLLVLPSYTGETWGLVVNEALHHGLFCVVSNKVGCAPDLIEPGVTGEIFIAGSVIDLVSVLKKAIEEAGGIQTREKCRQKVEPFSIENAAKGIADAYYTTLTQGKE